MGNKINEEIKKKAEDSLLWILEGRLNCQNRKLVMLAGQGVKSKDSKWKRIVTKRNIYRKVLLDKLRLWENRELKEGLNPEYSDWGSMKTYNAHGEDSQTL